MENAIGVLTVSFWRWRQILREKTIAHQAIATHGVMESGGFYNLHAKVPAGGANLALPFLEGAVRELTLIDSCEPIIIGDYGSSQGKNSLAPVRAAVKGLRARVGNHRPILVTHVDQATNDFNTLFGVLHSDPERYSLDDPNVFPSAIGRSFYESVFPKEHVHLGWSSYAAVWLSRIPRLVPGHFVAMASVGEVRQAFDRQGADDWKLFLSLRASELRPGGRLVVVLPGLGDDGLSGFEPLFELANEAIGELLADRAVTTEERERMVLGAYPRRRSQLLAPFNTNREFHGLTVEHCELSALPDAAWEDYDRDRNKELLVMRHARFFRSVFVPSLAAAIADHGRRNTFPDDLEEKLKRRLAERPAPFHSFVQTIVLAKQDSADAKIVAN
jgi:S-adenosylmethionine-dependent carboxyl methyltransferase